MNDSVRNVLIFAAGFLTGALAAKFYLKKKDKKEEAKETEEKKAEEKPDIPEDFGKAEPVDYAEVIRKYNSDPPPAPVYDDNPYIISEDQYEEDPEYGSIALAYFADGALADADTNTLLDDDRDIIVGTEFIEKFAEDPELDTVYVCNDARKFYFEISRDPRNYLDVVKANPYLMEDYCDEYYDD